MPPLQFELSLLSQLPKSFYSRQIRHTHRYSLQDLAHSYRLYLPYYLHIHVLQFLQLLNVRHSHWILVSNVGCDKGVVHVYDTMYFSIPLSTVHTITRLVLCPTSKLTLKMVDVDLQRNSSDCGVLCLAIAFDVLSARAPQVAAYTHKLASVQVP